jgi:hypothetical protein
MATKGMESLQAMGMEFFSAKVAKDGTQRPPSASTHLCDLRAGSPGLKFDGGTRIG